MDSLPIAVLRLPAIFSEHMILRAGCPNPLWGWAVADATVAASFQGQTKTTVANNAGRWRLDLPAAPAGGPYMLEVSSGKEIITFSDVLAGDVWLCSGQSNMEWPVIASDHADKEVAAGNYPQIRLLTIPHMAHAEAQSDVTAKWEVCTPEVLRNFSAVGYFFGRDIHLNQKIPVGLINSSWGGTVAEAWTERSFLEGKPAFANFMVAYQAMEGRSEEEKRRVAERLENWRKVERFQDPGNRAYFHGWAAPEADESEWRDYHVPGLWQQRGMLHNGAVWFRKKIAIPAEWAGRNLVLSLGALDDYDETYFNDEKVGATGKETPNWWSTSRRYTIPASLVRTGTTNTIAVRIFDDFGQGGFGKGAARALYPEGKPPESGVDLDGVWKCRVEYALEAKTPAWIQMPGNEANPQNLPTHLYNGMIAPLTPYGLSGTIWYQGESNADRPEQYKLIMTRLIESWRRHFENPEMPFFFVLLANFQSLQTEPVESGWGEIREAQMDSLRLPHTGAASAIDVGNANDVHPTDKQTVGRRLALLARALVHHEKKIVYSGPLFKEATREGNRMRLSFSHTGSGLKTRDGGPLKGFALRGTANDPWLWAQAEIKGDAVAVWHRDLPEPKEIRYAWASNPIGNLSNQEGLPAFPFRTTLT